MAAKRWWMIWCVGLWMGAAASCGAPQTVPAAHEGEGTSKPAKAPGEAAEVSREASGAPDDPTAPLKRAEQPQHGIEALVIHPIFERRFTTNEHHDGQLGSLGDALGSDCIIHEIVDEDGRLWLRAYKGDGARNEDWYGWRQAVLAPVSGQVLKINVNPTVNEPGSFTPGVASYIILKRDDGVHVLLAHIREPVVAVGDVVEAGQKVALVGNNGNSRHPHIHIGAWKDKTPLQLRFDLTALGRLRQTHP